MKSSKYAETPRLEPVQAKRYLLAYQGLDGGRPFDKGAAENPDDEQASAAILAFFARVACIQFDPLNISGRNHELVLAARFPWFRRRHLDSLLYEKHRLIDGLDKVQSIYAREDWPYFARHRAYHFSRLDRGRDELRPIKDQILETIRNNGPLSSLDLKSEDMNRRIDWSWAKTRLARAALESLNDSGEVVVHHRSGTRKYYDLPERLLHPDFRTIQDPFASEEDYVDWRMLRRIRGIGMARVGSTGHWLGTGANSQPRQQESLSRLEESGKVFRVMVGDLAKPFYAASSSRDLMVSIINGAEGNRDHCTFIAPLDNLIWERPILKDLFAFDYTWDVYKPVELRSHGYYVLPVLYGTELIARAEPVFDAKARKLVLKNWWWEERADSEVALTESAISEAIGRLGAFLEAGAIEISAAAAKSLKKLGIRLPRRFRPR